MADIHIVREHGLGLERARKLAFRWAEVAERKLQMECTYEEGKTADVVGFRRPGASGELKVTRDRFVLDARLGLLLGVFKGRIEGEIVKNLDELLEHEDPLHAFEQGLATHEAKHDARHGKHAKAHVAKAPVRAPRKRG
ncbi:MAG TPA: polyhydroxyalkanoic acid system family protein [Ramlibacter sp.]|nr:polyhydroxyalkanoic acid system family protein [Ramlibacter sp.]